MKVFISLPMTAIRYGIKTCYFVEEDKYGWIF